MVSKEQRQRKRTLVSFSSFPAQTLQHDTIGTNAHTHTPPPAAAARKVVCRGALLRVDVEYQVFMQVIRCDMVMPLPSPSLFNLLQQKKIQLFPSPSALAPCGTCVLCLCFVDFSLLSPGPRCSILSSCNKSDD